MQKALDVFEVAIERARHLGGVQAAIAGLTTSALDTSDILRAQIVLGVSGFDYFVHEITVLGMLQVWSGTRQPTDAYSKFKVSMGALAGNNGSSPAWFEAEIREKHSFLAFQQPDKVADAIRLFSPATLWRDVSVKMGRTEADVKNSLRLIIDRRNKIAHEADLDPSFPGLRWPIVGQDVIGTLDFLQAAGKAIHSVVA